MQSTIWSLQQYDLQTEHNFLRWLMQVVDPNGTLMCWRLRLAQYEFVLHLKRGIVKNWTNDFSGFLLTGTQQPKKTLRAYVYQLSSFNIKKPLEESHEQSTLFIDEPMTYLKLVVAQSEVS